MVIIYGQTAGARRAWSITTYCEHIKYFAKRRPTVCDNVDQQPNAYFSGNFTAYSVLVFILCSMRWIIKTLYVIRPDGWSMEADRLY